MPRKPTPPPAELGLVRRLAAELAEAERQVQELRDRRNRAMVMAKAAGATGDQLGAAAGMARRNAVEIVSTLAGLDDD
ncbi:hypothetical protein [Saccharothrix sp. HUAS TT1]|uniref:hypothetical protein n=1 Tax=unclassified Saccharothrix TaxID=2593673 RepID=UPI00345C27D0